VPTVCNICRQTYCPSGCPNFEPRKSGYICDFCGNDIFVGEVYVDDGVNNTAHLDCINGIRQFINWVGLKVKVMED